MHDIATQIMSDIIVYSKYARYIEKEHRRETWSETVDRNKAMHLKKFPTLKDEIEGAYKLVYERKILPSMRSLQFGGKAIELNNSRLYNCCFMPMDNTLAFSELMFLLLSGCGVGYSVQKHHVDKLPELIIPKKEKRFVIGDSIIGWSDAIKVLIKAYFTGNPRPRFDFSDIRPKGMPLKTSGGIAPGPEPLKDCLHNIQKILDRKQTGDKLTPIEVHDINCYIAEAVRSGGIRRAAMIALFSFNDEDMLTSKFGAWSEDNPQRGRANNSAVILRHKIRKEDFKDLWSKIENSKSGEPGFFMSNDQNWGLNPCAEISLRPFQFCNLVTINVSDVDTQEELELRAKAAAFIATLQASYTDFHYLREIWKKTTEKDALIGVSMTGIASGDVLKLDLKSAAELVKTENARVAKLVDINKAARCTTVKPEGTASLVVGSSSGIHPWHSEYYLRRVRVGKSEPLFKYLNDNHPELLEDDFFKPQTESVVAIPQRAPEEAITRKESALDLLDRVTYVYKNWVLPGHRNGHNTNNVSTTVTIKPDEWEEVGEWMWKHRDEYTALSVLPYDNHTYVQAPFEDTDEGTYNKTLKKLKEINLANVIEVSNHVDFQESLACAGGTCEIR